MGHVIVLMYFSYIMISENHRSSKFEGSAIVISSIIPLRILMVGLPTLADKAMQARVVLNHNCAIYWSGVSEHREKVCAAMDRNFGLF